METISESSKAPKLTFLVYQNHTKHLSSTVFVAIQPSEMMHVKFPFEI